jgi:hypothetical protein
MKTSAVRIVSLIVLTLAVAAAPAAAQDGAFTDRTQEWVEYHGDFLVPCAAGGAGEHVAATLRLHRLTHVVVAPSGTQHALIEWNIVLSGQGATTGDQYHGSAHRQVNLNTGGAQFEYRERLVLHLVGAGSGSNFRYVEAVVRIVYDANGILRIGFEDNSLVCR